MLATTLAAVSLIGLQPTQVEYPFVRIVLDCAQTDSVQYDLSSITWRVCEALDANDAASIVSGLYVSELLNYVKCNDDDCTNPNPTACAPFGALGQGSFAEVEALPGGCYDVTYGVTNFLVGCNACP